LPLGVEVYKGKPVFYGLGSFSFHTGAAVTPTTIGIHQGSAGHKPQPDAALRWVDS
jgi:poly-gamma-glutamate capsule biosynthesis protein CapA/YwtB (metallophosphatase superfamily)